jgi:hypothetical protein
MKNKTAEELAFMLIDLGIPAVSTTDNVVAFHYKGLSYEFDTAYEALEFIRTTLLAELIERAQSLEKLNALR